jgi:hypothetical protein
MDYRLPSGKYAIRVLVNNKPVLYELDPDFYDAIASIDSQQLDAFAKVARYMNSYFN